MITRNKLIKIGVLGARRGESFTGVAADLVGMELVALCDRWEEYVETLTREINKGRIKNKVTAYTDYDKFLEYDMDAVVLANYFHEHAPFAIKALNAGKHRQSASGC